MNLDSTYFVLNLCFYKGFSLSNWRRFCAGRERGCNTSQDKIRKLVWKLESLPFYIASTKLPPSRKNFSPSTISLLASFYLSRRQGFSIPGYHRETSTIINPFTGSPCKQPTGKGTVCTPSCQELVRLSKINSSADTDISDSKIVSCLKGCQLPQCSSCQSHIPLKWLGDYPWVLAWDVAPLRTIAFQLKLYW